ncbi:hypothetical protein [Sandaracinus amylolyticus]|uniref:Uncharacterized protein n=1 Tax=Sandaracinus amylolyticus TaxID=927083 RepID=A0A0F6SEB6_9BACT|nr:hypothetical protein [Sandaracinus amylolyticus]AKF04909.1 hypothetical protein DB32_002058 [Sandaracinus amylolyticus]
MRSRGWLGIAALALLAGCDGSSLECGEGTIEQDGRCVSSTTYGPGTERDPETGACVPSETVECATGTRLVEGECVPDGSVVCSGNTVFDPARGACVLDPDACAEGTVLVEGRCVPFDDTLVGDVHAAAEPDDPRFDGDPAPMSPPSIGDTVTIDGCIAPANFDEDDRGIIDVDVDHFAFTVAQPGLYRVRADGKGGLSAAFAIASTDPALDTWFRLGIDLASDGSERQVWLPRAGTYVLMIFDSRSATLDLLPSRFTFARPVGGEGTCYFASVEGLETPSPTALTASTRTGALGDPQFFAIASPARTVLQARLTASSAAAMGGLVMSVGTTFHGERAASPRTDLFSEILEAGDSLLLVVDAVYDYAATPVAYDLEVRRPPRLPDEGTLTIEHDEDEAPYFWFEGQAGDVMRMAIESDGARLYYYFYDREVSEIVAPICVDEPCTAAERYAQLTGTGRYVARIYNVDGEHGVDYDVALQVEAITPIAAAVGTPSTIDLSGGRYGFVAIDASSVDWGRYVLSSLAGTDFVEAQTLLFMRDEEGVLAMDRGPGNVSAIDALISAEGFSRIYGDGPGELLIAVNDPNGSELDESLDLALVNETFVNVPVTPGTPVTRAADTIAADTSRLYLVRAPTGTELTFRATGAGSADVAIDELEADVTVVDTVDATGGGQPESMARTVGPRGWIALAVRTVDGSAGEVGIAIDSEPPAYSFAPGARRFADVCAAGVELVDDDDAMSGIVPLDTFAGFELFGTSVDQILVSTNGWLTIDGSYLGDSIGSGGVGVGGQLPDGVIAAQWTDLVARVCARQTAGELVVQWTGQHYNTGEEIEMQVVLSGTSRIELVYGPHHGPRFTEQQVGLESPDGGVALMPPLALLGADRSVVATARP